MTLKRNSPLSGSCLLAAERIQFWFGRDRDSLFPLLIKRASFHDFLSSHTCDLVKVPRIPSQVEQIPHYGFQIRKNNPQKRKLDSARKEKIDLDTVDQKITTQINRSALQTHCCVNQKTPYLILEHTLGSGDLSSNRIINCKLKEHFLASRRLKNLHKGLKSTQKHYDFVPLNPQKKAAQTSKDQEYWEDLIHSKEHHTFQKLPIQ